MKVGTFCQKQNMEWWSKKLTYFMGEFLLGHKLTISKLFTQVSVPLEEPVHLFRKKCFSWNTLFCTMFQLKRINILKEFSNRISFWSCTTDPFNSQTDFEVCLSRWTGSKTAISQVWNWRVVQVLILTFLNCLHILAKEVNFSQVNYHQITGILVGYHTSLLVDKRLFVQYNRAIRVK